MRQLVFVAMAICVGMAVAEKYSDKYDNFDIKGLIAKPEEFKKFSGCFLDRNECTSKVAADFKKDLPEAFQQACAKCTEAQKRLIKEYMAEVKKNYPEDSAAFTKKYDPENKYLDKLKKAVANA